MSSTPAGQLILTFGANFFAREKDAPIGGTINAGEHIEQG